MTIKCDETHKFFEEHVQEGNFKKYEDILEINPE